MHKMKRVPGGGHVRDRGHMMCSHLLGSYYYPRVYINSSEFMIFEATNPKLLSWERLHGVWSLSRTRPYIYIILLKWLGFKTDRSAFQHYRGKGEAGTNEALSEPRAITDSTITRKFQLPRSLDEFCEEDLCIYICCV